MAPIRLEVDLAEITRLNLWLDDHPDRPTLSQANFDDIKLCLNEIVANAISYGFPDGAQGGKIDVNLGVQEDRAVAIVTDNGIAFDPLAAPVQPPITDIETAQVGGFGLMLVRKTASQLSYKREGNQNQLTMIFEIA
ncbi:MAG: ATP-binding protein [Pseudomonadota bacterium]